MTRALKLCKTPLQRANKRKAQPEIRIEPIVSNPCFEVWILLHFRYCDQPFSRFTDVEPVLKAVFSDYFKADPRIFTRVGGGDGLERALRNTAQLRDALLKSRSNSPSTDMDHLVEALRSIVHQS